MNILLWSFPVFLILIAIEAISSRYDESKRYRLNDSISNLSCGIFDQVTNAFIGTIVVGVFALINEHYGIVSFDARNPLTWILLLLGVDFAYYLFHRASHRSNILWAAHITHHQSESYNLTVSLRQGTVATWVSYMFYLPLAVVGFSAPMFLVMHGLYQVYQFLVHTNAIKTLGPLELFIATPELHRVHHSRNDQYLDKNYGGLFNFWDRMFGSFQKFTRTPDYGITTGIRKWNPLWGNFHHYIFLWRSSAEQKTMRDKMKIWFGAPEEIKLLVPVVQSKHGYDTTISARHMPLVIAQTAATVAASFFLLFYKEQIDTAPYIFSSLAILVSLININALFDKARWVAYSQIGLGVLCAVVAILFLAQR